MIGLIFGPPGSGKGTQATRVADALEIAHLSTGDMLRREVAAGTPLGREVGKVMAAGDLVPDELMDRLVEARVTGDNAPAGILLDGFPRTVVQAEALDRVLAGRGDGVGFVLALEAPEELLIERLLKRAAIQGRSDDTQAVIEERMREYHHRTAPVLDHYRAAGVPVLEVHGVGTVEEVFDRVDRALDELQSSSSR